MGSDSSLQPEWLTPEALEKARRRLRRRRFVRRFIAPWWSYALVLILGLGLIGGTLVSASLRPPDTPTPTYAPTPTSATLPGGFLRVAGQQIVTDSGEPIVLRGINMDGFYEEYAQRFRETDFEPVVLGYASQEDIAGLAAGGVNVIRLGLHWRAVENRFAFEIIDQYVAWCEAAGIYIILDLHVVPFHDTVADNQIWYDLEAQRRLIDMWQLLTVEYRNEPTIAGYDLFNRPDPPDDAMWWELAQLTIDAIRAEGDRHIIFVEKPIRPGAPFRLLDDSNVVYTFRDYEPYLVTHAAADWTGDTRLPGYAYPGMVLTELEPLGEAEALEYTTPGISGWVDWDSGLLRPPLEADWASLVLYAEGETDVSFDEVQVFEGPALVDLPNLDFELAARNDPSRPLTWHFYTDGEFVGVYETDAAVDPGRSRYGQSRYGITIRGRGNRGEWRQGQWLLTGEYFPVLPNQDYRIRVWLSTLGHNGAAGATLAWYRGHYEHFDAARLRAIVEEQVAWAVAHNVPLFVSEFGATRFAPNRAKYLILRDRIAIYSELGLSWTVWNFREAFARRGFALYEGAIDRPAAEGELDTEMYRILLDGWAGRQPD